MAADRIVSRVSGVLLGLACFAAHAQSPDIEPAFYVGAGAGESRHALDKRYYQDERYGHLEANLDQSRSSYLIYAGYRANRYLAIEAGIQDLGGSDQWHDPCPAFVPCPTSADYGPYQIRESTRRASLALVVIRPLGDRFELFAKLGVARSKHTTDILHDPGSRNIYGGWYYTTDRLVSAGASYLFKANWALRLQWDRTELPFRSPWYRGITDIDAVSLALERRFN